LELNVVFSIRLFRTAVARDYVEFPSQILGVRLGVKQGIALQTNEPIRWLVERIDKASTFNGDFQ
jgi:Zn-dependent oligopeptidase